MNIDEAFIAEKVHVGTGEALVALSNGCICCSIREDLVREIRTLAQQRRFDCLIVESTGVSLPLPVAATFGFVDDSGRSLSDIARLDSLVTVVDAERFVSNVLEAESLKDKGMAVDENDDRTVADLLIEQVRGQSYIASGAASDICCSVALLLVFTNSGGCTDEQPQWFCFRHKFATAVNPASCDPNSAAMQVEFADLLILNKVDLVTAQQAEQLEALLHKLNKKAKVRGAGTGTQAQAFGWNLAETPCNSTKQHRMLGRA